MINTNAIVFDNLFEEECDKLDTILLEIAKENKLKGDLTNFALGKNKIPENFSEVFKLTLLKKWRKK